MAEVSYPSPAHNARNVTDREYELISARNNDDGLYPDQGSGDPVVAGTGLQVLVKAGHMASVRGHAWEAGATDVPLAISANASGLTRNDWVVLRLDRSTWTVRATILEGTPGQGTPAWSMDVGPTGYFDIPLAYVTIPSGANSVTVTPYIRYTGTRIRPVTSTSKVGGRRLGEIYYVMDTGAWEGYDGSKSHVIFSESGDITLTGSFSTWSKAADCIGRRVGATVSLRLAYRRENSTFSSNDASGSRLAILPSTLTPRRFEYGTAVFGNGAVALVRVQNDGEIWVDAPSKDVPPGYSVRLTITYLS